MRSIIKRFVIEHVKLRLPKGNVKPEERQVNNMVGYIVTTSYQGTDTAEVRFHDANGRVIEAMTLKNGTQKCFFQRPISMYVNDITLTYFQPAGSSDTVDVDLSLIGEKEIDITSYRNLDEISEAYNV